MNLRSEIKRKLFHHLAIGYLVVYGVCPRSVSLALFGAMLLVFAGVEFIRLRRPEVNAWFLEKFAGIVRESEIMHLSGIFWTLLGCWGTMVIFTSERIVLTALGFLVFGDAAAALIGKTWGRRPWSHDPSKTLEGSAGFVIVSALWALFFLKWPVALTGALAGAWVESRKWKLNDNLWIPLTSAMALSVLNLMIGR